MQERLPQVLDVDSPVCALFSWAPSGEIEEDADAVEQDVLMFNITAISNVENALKRKQTDFTNTNTRELQENGTTIDRK